MILTLELDIYISINYNRPLLPRQFQNAHRGNGPKSDATILFCCFASQCDICRDSPTLSQLVNHNIHGHKNQIEHNFFTWFLWFS